MQSVEKSSNVSIIAGPNGAGKTTFARQFLPFYAKCKNFVNADLIAQGLAPFAPESAAIKAGRILLEQIHSLVDQRADYWSILDNAIIPPRLIARSKEDKLEVLDATLYNRVFQRKDA